LKLSDDSGYTVQILTHGFGAVEIVLSGTDKEIRWSSDPGVLKAFGDNSIAVTVDNDAKLIQFIVNGVVHNGGDARQYGWKRFEEELPILREPELKTGKLNTGAIRGGAGYLKSLRIYSRPLLNTELIGNHRIDAKNYFIPQLPKK
jgi:hypothetical protein